MNNKKTESTKKQEVAAVLVTYNRLPLLKEAIRGIQSQTYDIQNIYIIDNASTDETQPYLMELASNNPKIQYIRLPLNTGGAGGFYAGLEAATRNGHDWVWLMDDDAEPLPDTLEKLLCRPEGSSPNEPVALIPQVIDVEAKIHLGHQGFFDEKAFTFTALSERDHQTEFLAVDYCSFVGPLLSREAIKRAGLPNKNYFIWHDDTEYMLRIRKLGNIILIPASKIIHKDRLVRIYSRKKKISEKIREWRPAAGQEWKYLCGLRNKLHMAGYHAKNPTVARTKIIATTLIRLLFSGGLRPPLSKLLPDYVRMGVGKRPFQTITPSEWKKLYNPSSDNNASTARKN